MAVNCDSLEHVRGHIDALDRQIVALLAEHSALDKPLAQPK